MSASLITPALSGCRMSPASLIAPARVSTKIVARFTASSSLSRMVGLKAPIRSRWAPGFSQAP
ncbi:hypothetical protein D3C72_2373810 [compost metagenome]